MQYCIYNCSHTFTIHVLSFITFQFYCLSSNNSKQMFRYPSPLSTHAWTGLAVKRYIPAKGHEAVANVLTGIKISLLNYLFVFNWSQII